MQAEHPDDIPVRLDGLQLAESRPLQRKIWMTQRILWLLCACVILAALAGATGRGGIMSERDVVSATAKATLPRVTRRGSVAELRVTYLNDSHDHRLLLTESLLDWFEVETVTPRPVAEMATQDGTVMIFAADGRAPHRVTLHLRSTTAAIGQVALTADGARLAAGLLILP